jgi:hypothetical protein
MRIPALLGIALGALTLLPLQAAATPISTTIELNTVFAGGTPNGNVPWLTATFTSSVGSKTGTLVMSLNTNAPDFIQGLNNKNAAVGWAFYLDQGLSGLTCENNGGNCASNNALYNGSFNSGPVPGPFNLAFGWSAQDRFMSGDSATYELTFLDLLTGNPFVESAGGWSSVAHIQGFPTNLGCGTSGWIVSGSGSGAQGNVCDPNPHTPPPVNVPEPGELGIFGLGLLFAGLFLGLRRRED